MCTWPWILEFDQGGVRYTSIACSTTRQNPTALHLASQWPLQCGGMLVSLNLKVRKQYKIKIKWRSDFCHSLLNIFFETKGIFFVLVTYYCKSKMEIPKLLSSMFKYFKIYCYYSVCFLWKIFHPRTHTQMYMFVSTVSK